MSNIKPVSWCSILKYSSIGTILISGSLRVTGISNRLIGREPWVHLNFVRGVESCCSKWGGMSRVHRPEAKRGIFSNMRAMPGGREERNKNRRKERGGSRKKIGAVTVQLVGSGGKVSTTPMGQGYFNSTNYRLGGPHWKCASHQGKALR